jgi:predicted small secreted protein
MKSSLICAAILVAAAGLASAETKSGLTESVTIGGKKIEIKYSSPAVNGRRGKLFGKDGTIGSDTGYPVWRAGANAATAFHTDADLDVGGLAMPKGDYTLFINLANPAAWELIINKQTGQSGLEYDAKQDLGRVKMTMSKPPAMVEQMKFTLSSAGGNKGKLELAWEDHVASVNFTVK